MSTLASNIELPALKVPPLERQAPDQLAAMEIAAADILECYRVLNKGGCNIVGEILFGRGTFYELNHYPKDDVYDAESFSQYYYHAHRGNHIEHGHFHTFQRVGRMPESNIEPVQYAGSEPWPEGDLALSHLVAISMNAAGFPSGLFATNRWVTGETWYRAEDVVGLLDHFVIDHAFPSWPVNRWISAMFKLFRPEIEALIRDRDEVVGVWADRHPDIDVYEDRALEITGFLPISVEQRIAQVRAALG